MSAGIDVALNWRSLNRYTVLGKLTPQQQSVAPSGKLLPRFWTALVGIGKRFFTIESARASSAILAKDEPLGAASSLPLAHP